MLQHRSPYLLLSNIVTAEHLQAEVETQQHPGPSLPDRRGRLSRRPPCRARSLSESAPPGPRPPSPPAGRSGRVVKPGMRQSHPIVSAEQSVCTHTRQVRKGWQSVRSAPRRPVIPIPVEAGWLRCAGYGLFHACQEAAHSVLVPLPVLIPGSHMYGAVGDHVLDDIGARFREPVAEPYRHPSVVAPMEQQHRNR